MCLAMEYGGEKSLSDLIEERNAARLGPFPAATIGKVALSMARGLKVGYGVGETKTPNCGGGERMLRGVLQGWGMLGAVFAPLPG